MKKQNPSIFDERFIYFMRMACSDLSNKEFLSRLKRFNNKSKVKNGNR
jgi:hypothetical protein